MVEGFSTLYAVMTAIGLMALVFLSVGAVMGGYTPLGDINTKRMWVISWAVTLAMLIIGLWGSFASASYYNDFLERQETEEALKDG